jgi:hypothetical protein
MIDALATAITQSALEAKVRIQHSSKEAPEHKSHSPKPRTQCGPQQLDEGLWVNRVHGRSWHDGA